MSGKRLEDYKCIKCKETGWKECLPLRKMVICDCPFGDEVRAKRKAKRG